MISNLFQSIGIVVLLILIVVTTVAFMYISYILAIGGIVLILIFITYHIISTVRRQT